jgi:Tol biopolymer transport system component
VGVQQRGELVRYDATARQFVPYRKGLSAEMLDYSKDRERVAYITYPEGDLWQSKLDGSARLQLSFAPMQAAVPRWSPDGKRIAFLGRLPGKPWKVYLIPSEGGAPQQLMPEERYENDPSWSPDGNTLAFGTNPETNLPAAIKLLDLRTRQVTTLPGSEGFFSPRWSPDGRYIAAIPVKVFSLMLYDLQMQKWSEIAKGVGNPHWSRDGKYIYFSGVYRSRIADLKREQLASVEGIRLAIGTFGSSQGQTEDE